MLGIANNNFGCAQGDVQCYCREPNFGYGVRDCANEACSSEDAGTVIAFGTQYCQGKQIRPSPLLDNQAYISTQVPSLPAPAAHLALLARLRVLVPPAELPP